MRHQRVLVVEDDRDAGEALRAMLGLVLGSGVPVDLAPNGSRALEMLKGRPYSVAITDLRMPHLSGMDLLREVQALQLKVTVVVTTGYGSINEAVEAMRFGAYDFLTKPIEPEQLGLLVQRALRERLLQDELIALRAQLAEQRAFKNLVSKNPRMLEIFDLIKCVAETTTTVLIEGETGTGKELVARAIHRRSPRASGPFVPVDCGAIPDNLIESELFGHERGAFTGADSRRIGLLEFADNGTIFLDELGELPLALQAKLLRTLQERKVRRVGGREEVDVDVRVVAATARDLDAMIRQGLFRQDLYYRINVVRIDLPPLRDRGDDIGLLAEYFANRHSREMKKQIAGITPEAYQVLRQYPWPGNVRELQNIVRRGIALTKGTLIGLDDLPDDVVIGAGQRDSSDTVGYFQIRDEHVKRFERQYLMDLLERHHGEVQSAAREAKLPRGTLYRLMKNHGLDSGEFR